MKFNATVLSVTVDTYEKNGVKHENNLHLLFEQSEAGEVGSKQIFEYQRPVTEKPLERGALVEVNVTEIVNIFSGRVRFRGSVVPL